MDNLFILLSVVFTLLGLALLSLWYISRRNFGVLSQTYAYTDTGRQPGRILRSKTIPLVGKPDYLIINNSQVIPVEVKSGNTPNTPKKHHVMQLMAYCYLVEENYGVTPKIAILKYPHREFQIEYSPALRNQVREVVFKILDNKRSNTEPHCYHPHHNIARQSGTM